MTETKQEGFHCEVIGRVRSPFKEKFGIPRQPGVVEAIAGQIELLPPWNTRAIVDRLDEYSHLWVSFIFHECVKEGWRARVRPPRLGGNERVGVFASRSPFRPNHLGLSVVRLLGIIDTGSGISLSIAGLDMLDNTPVVDIKPYVPYADCVSDAVGGFAPSSPEHQLQVRYAEQVRSWLAQRADAADLERSITALLALDPRPAYHGKADHVERIYGMRLFDLDIRWRVNAGQVLVLEINELAG